MLINISETTIPQLNWLVATCQKKQISVWGENIEVRDTYSFEDPYVYSPATDWRQGGPFIDKYKIIVDMYCNPDEWRAALADGDFYDEHGEWIEGSNHEQTGPTPLIAIMRCYVSSVLGNEVNITDWRLLQRKKRET